MKNPLNFSNAYPLDILIAEPHQDPRLSPQSLLIHLGYNPELASTSEEILAMTSRKSYDVVLMDVRLPSAEDIMAYRLSRTGTRHPILIAMTMNGQADLKHEFLEAGLDHTISKPVDLAELSLQLMACSLLTGSRRIRG